MNPITIPNISIPTIGIPTIGIPSVGFPSASGGGGLSWPAGMKEHIKAWYDPKKQGLTNFDVIEAYTEDFKKWNNSPEKYTGSLTSNSLALTNVSQKTALIYSPIKPYDFKVLIRGLQEGQHVKFGLDYGEHILEADKDGVYTLEWKEGLISYGIYTNFVGECNITITQLPTSILKDLSGNGNHAYLYGGKGKLNSGMGVYKVDFTSWTHKTFLNEIRPEKFITNDGSQYAQVYIPDNVDIPSFKVKYKLIKGDRRFLYYYVNEKGETTKVELNKDGEYTLPANYGTKEHTSLLGFISERNGICSIEQIPDYPNQLCYDGKMYAVCYGFPILEDYTVIADRTWFDKTGVRCFCSKYKDSTVAGLFRFEWVAGNKEYTSSLGKDTNVVFVDSNITWQTKTSYNGKALTNLQYEDGEHLIIGNRYEGDYSTYIGCHGKIIIADRSFTEEEINWLKDNWKKI